MSLIYFLWLRSRKSLGEGVARAGGDVGRRGESGQRREDGAGEDYATTCLGTPTDQPVAGSGWGPMS